jgi:hypothetical protein
VDSQSPIITEVDEVERHLLLQRKLTLERARLQLVKDFGLAFYKPYPKQEAFHRAGAKKLRMYRAGNRSGKSTMGCAEDCAWMLGYRPWVSEGDEGRTIGIPQRPVKVLVITTDWDKVDEIFTSQKGEGGKLWRMLPRGFVKSTRRNHAGAIETIECENGSILRFDTVKSFQTNPQGAESSDWDGIHVDEPCTQDHWKASSRGLIDRNGKAWFTLTPLSQFWINDLFFPGEYTQRKKREDVWAESGSMTDNPHLTREAIDAFIAELTEDEIQCRIHGVPLELSGLVYKQFSFAKHVLQKVPVGWAAYHEPPKNYLINVRIDPHPQTPHAVLFEAVSPQLQRFFYHEIFEHTTIDKLCAQILKITEGYYVNSVRVDPIAKIHDPITGGSMITEMFRCGLMPTEASKAKAYGILNTQKVLSSVPQTLYVSPELRRFLFEIHRYCYDKENKPIDADDHMMENMYRMLLDEATWFDPDKAPAGPTDDLVIAPNSPDPFEFGQSDD